MLLVCGGPKVGPGVRQLRSNLGRFVQLLGALIDLKGGDSYEHRVGRSKAVSPSLASYSTGF